MFNVPKVSPRCQDLWRVNTNSSTFMIRAPFQRKKNQACNRTPIQTKLQVNPNSNLLLCFSSWWLMYAHQTISWTTLPERKTCFDSNVATKQHPGHGRPAGLTCCRGNRKSNRKLYAHINREWCNGVVVSTHCSDNCQVCYKRRKYTGPSEDQWSTPSYLAIFSILNPFDREIYFSACC